MKPLLLIDVDGPLNPYAAKPTRRPLGYQTHRMNPRGYEHRSLRVWLNPDHGPKLLELPFDLVWATTWGHQANTMIGPNIGLPELPVIEFEDHRLPSRSDGTYFKTHDIVKWAEGRPFAWIDDEILDFDKDYVAKNHKGPALLHRVSQYVALKNSDFDTLREWAINHGG